MLTPTFPPLSLHESGLRARVRLASALASSAFSGCFLLVCAAMSMLSGCNHSSSSSTTETTAFTMASIQPADGATDVAPEAEIRAEFSSDVLFNSVTGDSFRVTANEIAVSGDYVATDARTVTFRPHAALPEDTEITVQLTDQIETASGAVLEPVTIRFRTRVPPEPPVVEPEALRVVGARPAPYAQAAAVDAIVELEFSAPLDAATVHAGNIWVNGSLGGGYDVSVELDPATGQTLQLSSSEDWLAGETITVSVLDGVRAVEDHPFSGMTYTFRVRTPAAARQLRDGGRWIAPGPVKNLRIGDLDGDSNLDLAYRIEDGSAVEILRGSGGGAFEAALRIDTGQRVTSLSLADVDGDGALDLLVGAPDRVYRYLSEVDPRNGTLFFTQTDSYITRAMVHSITVTDIDHRETPDLVLSTDTGIQVFLNDSSLEPAYVLGGTHVAHTAVVAADLELDGHFDLVYGAPGFNLAVYQLAGPGAGEFGEPIPLVLPDAPSDVVADDFTGDGVPDIAALLASPGAETPPIVLLPQVGELAFVSETTDVFSVTEQAEAELALADLEGIGLPGALTASRPSRSLSYFAADLGAVPPWSSAEELHAGPVTGSIGAGDLDGDGHLDIAFASDSEIRLLLSSTAPPPPPPPELHLSVDQLEVRRGDAGAATSVRLNHSVAVEGATIVLGYDPLVVEAPTAELTGSALAGAEFISWGVVDGESALKFEALIDSEEPLDGGTLPPGENDVLFRFLFDVPADAPLGASALEFVNNVGTPPLSNGFIVGGETLAPTTTAGSTVLVQEPLPPTNEPNQIAVSTVLASPGTRLRLPVVANVDRDTQAFTIVASYEPDVLVVEDLSLVDSFTETLDPEFVSPAIDDTEGFFVLGVAFDLTFAGDNKVIPPGEDYVLFFIEIEVKGDAPIGFSPIAPTDGLNDPPLSNVFTAAGQSFFPHLVPGGVDIIDASVSLFLRGDTNNDASVNVADTISLTGCLFGNSSCPSCADAADANDDGRINIADPIFLLHYFFRGGAAPLPPGPTACGSDPTGDDLPCIGVSGCSS